MRRLVAGALLLLAPTALSAPPSPANVAKYRQQLMHAAGSHIGALSMIAKGESDRTQDMAAHADALLAIAKATGALFPEGTGPGVAGVETDAKAEIWSSKDKFAVAVKAFEDACAKLDLAAKANDLNGVKTALGAVGDSCGDCHDGFRVEHDH